MLLGWVLCEPLKVVQLGPVRQLEGRVVGVIWATVSSGFEEVMGECGGTEVNMATRGIDILVTQCFTFNLGFGQWTTYKFLMTSLGGAPVANAKAKGWGWYLSTPVSVNKRLATRRRMILTVTWTKYINTWVAEN